MAVPRLPSYSDYGTANANKGSIHVPSDLVTFGQIVAKARQRDNDVKEKPAPDISFGKRTKPEPEGTGAQARLGAVDRDYERPSDRTLSNRVTGAISQLQEAMDAAVRAGLMIEPSFKSVSGRFNEFGVSVESYICTVQILRKLS